MENDEYEVPLPKELEDAKIEPAQISSYYPTEKKEIDKLKKEIKDKEKSVKKLQKENDNLKKEIELLKKNNQEFAGLVQVLEDKIDKFAANLYPDYKYSFSDGGWVEKDSGKKSVLEKPKETVNPRIVKDQLKEIMRLTKKYKEK